MKNTNSWWHEAVIAVASFAAALLTACGSIPTDRGFRETLNQFHGGSIAAVEDRFGKPDLAEKKPDGNTLYTWRRMQTVPVAFHKGEELSEPMVTKVRVYGASVQESRVSGWPYGKQIHDANREEQFCFFVFETGAGQRVIGYEYWGNFCRLSSPPAAK
ncbi:MAG: hypothetical protein ACREUW_13495 [Burkholderiales bacterium]